ncbi:MAG: nicotinate phosphoribosyltransferase [Clostridiales bacterium]|nr:nicotinate phosphoribosyltransferase [Clostridiales bacterium]
MSQSAWSDKTNMSLLTDFYELTMANGYLDNDAGDVITYFDMFFRDVPEQGGFAICAGLEQVIDYLSNLHFSEEDLAFLQARYGFDERFIDYLRNFEFTCDVWAVPEGTVVFPREPLIKVRGTAIQAQLLETALLCTINHQSLIATKTARIVKAADGRPVMEFGARRAQGFDASVLGARAAYIAGAAGTSNTICGQQFDIPLSGTMAHSWVMLFDNEFDAFAAYAKTYPEGTVLLVDTYDVLRQGIPNAIRCAKEVLEPAGHRLKGIRIDSGDLTYMTQQARKMLDEAGLTDCKITVSNALDEYIIRDLISQGACIDAFGVGERLITSKAEPVFGGVYKISAVEDKDGNIIPKMKISENAAKVTNPCSKKIVRFYDNYTGKALADLIMCEDEEIPNGEPYEIFDPIETWNSKVVVDYYVKEIMVRIFDGGKLVYDKPTIAEIREYCAKEVDSLWDSVKRFENPHKYYVDLSQKLWDIKNDILHSYKKKA